MMPQHRIIIILGNILSVLSLLPVLLLLILSLIPFTDGTPPPTPLWYTLLISFLAIASLSFVVISLDYSHRKQSIKWAYAPFLVFGILECLIFVAGTYRLQQANQIEKQDEIHLQQLRDSRA